MKFSFSPSDPPVGLLHRRFQFPFRPLSRGCESERAFSDSGSITKRIHRPSDRRINGETYGYRTACSRSCMRVRSRDSQHVADGSRDLRREGCVRDEVGGHSDVPAARAALVLSFGTARHATSFLRRDARTNGVRERERSSGENGE